VESDFVDAVTPAAVAALGLAPTYPEILHAPCQGIAEEAYENGEHGVAVRSAVDRDGEELVVFDRDVAALARKTQRETFAQWYSKR
jgi:hypothetical protein